MQSFLFIIVIIIIVIVILVHFYLMCFLLSLRNRITSFFFIFVFELNLAFTMVGSRTQQLLTKRYLRMVLLAFALVLEHCNNLFCFEITCPINCNSFVCVLPQFSSATCIFFESLLDKALRGLFVIGQFDFPALGCTIK